VFAVATGVLKTQTATFTESPSTAPNFAKLGLEKGLWDLFSLCNILLVSQFPAALFFFACQKKEKIAVG
jgi:hypothetical protein